MITINETATMHELLSQVMESKRQVRIFVDGKPFEGHVVSLSSQFVELDDSLYPNPEPFLNQIVICINFSITDFFHYNPSGTGSVHLHFPDLPQHLKTNILESLSGPLMTFTNNLN